MNRLVLGLLIAPFIFIGGCASIEQALKFSKNHEIKKKRPTKRQLPPPKKIRKVTRQSLEDESLLAEDSGSLWVPRGQGAYLFHQNNNRIIGDMLNVEIDGDPKKQIESKVKNIADLMTAKNKRNFRKIIAKKNRRLVRKNRGKAVASKKIKKKKKIKTTVDGKFDVKMVPTKIVGVLKDGSFRVFGSQPFAIGKKTYQVLVSGIVRQEDFDDEGIGAEKLLDPQFDIVAARVKRKLR